MIRACLHPLRPRSLNRSYHSVATGLRLLSVATVIVVLLTHPVAAQGRAAKAAAPEISEDQIKRSIARGVAHLKTRIPHLQSGYLSLAVLGVLKGGATPDNPEVKVGIDRILSESFGGNKFQAQEHGLYNAGTTMLALSAADPVKYRPQLEAIIDYVVTMQGKDGDWDYPNNRTTGDTSISQYANLALWEGARVGIKIPMRAWDGTASWHTSRQRRDGSFDYHPTLGGDNTGTHTMTVAGLGSLHLARMHLYPNSKDVVVKSPAGPRRSGGKRFGILEMADLDEESTEAEKAAGGAGLAAKKPVDTGPYTITTRLETIDNSITKGFNWFDAKFSLSEEASSFYFYYLYGIERLAALSNRAEFNGHDWYAEGAAILLKKQETDGSWGSDGSETAFSIMFLARATAKMLGRAPTVATRFGAGLLAGGRGLPTNLSDVQLLNGQVQVKKMKGPVDDLLAELESADSRLVEAAQASLLEAAFSGDRETLVGQKDRLIKLAADPRPEVRRTAHWALGFTDDLKTVPVLIRGLSDADYDCVREAHLALRYISKRLEQKDLPDPLTDQVRADLTNYWRKWYFSVRPYDERDDFDEPKPNESSPTRPATPAKPPDRAKKPA